MEIASWLFFVNIFYLVASSSTGDDIFSSTAKLEGLLNKETNIVNILSDYLNSAKERLQIIEKYVASYQQMMDSDMTSSSPVKNPVDAFLLVKRLTIDWDVVEVVLNAETNTSRNTLDQLLRMRENDSFPKEEDLHGAAIALVRLQDTYRLNVTQLASGSFRGVDHSRERVFRSKQDLSGRDCLFLAQHAFVRGYYDTALQWAETARLRATNFISNGDEGEAEQLDKEVEEFLNMASNVHDDVLERQGPRGAHWQTNPFPTSRKFQLSHSDKYKSLAEQQFTPKLYQPQTEDEEAEHYERLCRGEKLRSPKVEAVLHCRLITRNHPYLLLQPVKVEQQSLDPSIVVFHDLLTEKQTDILRELAEPKLKTSMHRGDKGGFVRSMIRTSKNAWLQEFENSSLPGIRRRMEFVTGLIVGPDSSAEYFQIANYGIGGLYVTHTDNVIHAGTPPQQWDALVGDRIATLMVYLTDVEAGGATVFPRAGVTCWPRRGSAAFWWNLYRSGEPDPTTRHGACPVLHGSKWVSNKWIRQYDQMFLAKCGLHPLDKFTLL